ncbi:MAG: hypothetical protein K8T90_08600 [Planctomycetes bacterium]|nr:hypothetical protein [Planctomycetota bacterium]
MTKHTPLWLTLGAVATAFAAFALVAADTADAGRGRVKGRGRRHRFFSAQAPSKGRTPATDANGAAAGASRDVAGAAVEGPGRKNTLEGGTAIVLSATRALVANPYRGLAIVDVTNPDAPSVIGSVVLDGSADRVFVSGTTALVVSRSTDAAGGTTRVIAVDLSDEAAPEVTGDVSVAGDLLDVSQSGGELVLVTTSFSYAMYADAPTAGPGADAGGNPGGANGGTPAGDYVNAADNGMVPPGAPRKSARGAQQGDMLPGFWFPWGGDGKVRVARIGQDGTGAPVVHGEAAYDGTVLAQAISGDTAVLVLDRRATYYPGGPVYIMGNTPGASGGDPTNPGVPFSAGTIDLVVVDASAAPAEAGRTAMNDISGVGRLDVTGGVARLLAWANDGSSVLKTFSLAGGVPSALGSAALAAWPESTAFTADRLAFTTTTWNYTGDPTNPDGTKGNTLPAGGVRAEPTVSTTLTVVDLADASNPVVGGAADLAPGWVVSLVPASADVVATTSEWANETQTTHLERVNLTDASAPAVTASASFDGSWYASPNPASSTGDLLLLQGGAVNADGAWNPQALPVSLADGGVAVGAPFDATWIAASAWSAPILALGSADTLKLVDLTDLQNPVQRGSVRLAVNVADLAVVSDSAAACLVTDWVGGTIEIRTVSLPEADALKPLDTVTLGTGDARLFRDGSMLYVLSTNWSTGRGDLTVVDASDPSHLAVRGSLDLASYPGQAFVVNGAMVLVREAWSLVETNETTGKRNAISDPFGRCHTGWLRDELSAVIDIVDLSNPDAPRAARRKRVRWDASGEAMLRGNSLYVPSYQWGPPSPDGYDQVAYGIREIDLTDPLAARVGPLREVPGSLAAATDEAGRVLTVSYGYDDTTGVFDATLQLVDLRSTDWRTRVVAGRRLSGTPGAVVAGDGQAYVATESWNQATGSSEFELAALSLADLNVSSTQDRTRSGWGGTISGNHLFLRSWGWTGSIDAYSLADAAHPALAATAEVDGVGTSIGVAGGKAFVPAGYRGVLSFDLITR